MHLSRGSLFAAALLLLCAATVLAGGCSGGGGGSSGGRGGGSSGGASGGASQPPAGQYVNPAWDLAAPLPAALWPQDQAPATPMADWFGARPFLLDRSLWAQYGRAGQMPGRGALSAFGVGNSRVFGMIGLSYPFNTLHGMMGPAYQISSNGFFGDSALGLEVATQVNFAEEWVWKVRRQGIVVTKQQAAGVAMWSVDFAPPGIDAICRIVIVKNQSQRDLVDPAVLVRLEGGAAREGSRLVQMRGDRKMAIGAVPGNPQVMGNILRLSLGWIAPGDEKAALVYHVFSRNDPAAEAATIAQVTGASPDVLLDMTRGAWDAFFAAGARFELPDPKVQDWIDDMTVTAALQIAENGNATPLSRYTKTWMRDSEGPLRLFLLSGRHAAARRMLDAYWKTAILAGGIFNSMPVDLDTSIAPAPIDFMQGQFMPGRNPVEAPSYIALNAWEYYRATGDETLLREQYGFIEAAVRRQERSPQNLMKFNGDEPFRWVMAAALGLYEPENLGWSSNSAFLFVSAAERAAAIAGIVGETQDRTELQQMADDVRAATEANFWIDLGNGAGYYDVCKLFFNGLNVRKPFEDISLMPLRIGYASPRDPRARENLFHVMRTLGKPDGSILSPFLTALAAGMAGYDGMVPGYYLTNLALVDHPMAEKAFNRLGEVALASGEIAEGHLAGSDDAVAIQYNPDGGPDVVARFRPWEGALCAVGALDYLLGIQPDAASGRLALTPHLPNGWGTLAARGMAFGGQTYDVEVKDFGWRRLIRIRNFGPRPLPVDVGISVEALAFGALRIDGKLVPLPPVDAEFGRIATRVDWVIPGNAWVDIDIEYTK